MTDAATNLRLLLEAVLSPLTDQESLSRLVENALKNTSSTSSLDTRKSQWEYLLKENVLTLAATEGVALQGASEKYYDDMKVRLDLVLTFTEQDACEQTFPFAVLQDLLETQTIKSCSEIFSWIEARSQQLTVGMVPQKGKALILLRTLNDLLRRLSKMGSSTIFCGRILTFLSSVFPLGERSGVNLRGEYGPMWEGVELKKAEEPSTSDAVKEKEDSDKMQVDEAKAEEDTKKVGLAAKSGMSKEEFYNTFWSLQRYFSRPPLFASPTTLSEFKEAVNKVLPVIKEATAKERAMMGSRSSTNGTSTVLSKRKRESENNDLATGTDYFFAKFLTSPELLDLEIADTHFRRQFLFQILILLQHLLTFTKTAKALWSTPRNRSLQMDFTLEPDDAQWVQETMNKALEELRQTMPNGRVFADTVNTILEREKNWIKWKNELCAPFDKEPWSAKMDGKKVGLEEATRVGRQQMRESPKEWPWKFGSEPLTEIWEMGFRDLNDLRNPFQPGDIKDFVKRVKQEDARIDMRRKTLSKFATQAAAKAAPALAAIPAVSVSSVAEGSAAPAISTQSAEPAVKPEVASQMANATAESTPLHHSLPSRPDVEMSSAAESSPSVPPAGASSFAPQPASDIPPVVAAPNLPQPSTTALLAMTSDPHIQKLEESKQRWSWLALRTARDQYLQYFGRIGTGDIVRLQQEIEAEKEREKEREKEKEKQKTEQAPTTSAKPTVPMQVDQTAAKVPPQGSSPPPVSVSQSGDVMEEK